jgi:transposase InsO family protein
MLVLHDAATGEYAYGRKQGLTDTQVSAFTETLYDEAKKQGLILISMKDDWQRILAFENGDEGWLYVAVVVDLFNREVVGCSIKPRMSQRQSSVFFS